MPDYSIENSFEAESSRHLTGTLADMLKCHRKKTKILNALDFPMASAPHPPHPSHRILQHLLPLSICCSVAVLSLFQWQVLDGGLQPLPVLTISGILTAMAYALTLTCKPV